jgi:two-component SAPR family response regulator
MKERVYELFWPRYSYKSARDNLNTIIYRLRKLMGDSQEYLITDVNTIHFNSSCTQIDLDTFLEFIEHAKKAEAQGNLNLAIKMYKEAVELYKGDFLEGDLYHDFIRDERENLKNKFRYILFRMTQLSLNSGDPMEGLKWAKRLVEADPLCEAGYRLLMICCALVGNRSEIPRLFEKLNKKLQTYYKITADNKTVLLKETLLSGRTPEEKLWNEETII